MLRPLAKVGESVSARNIRHKPQIDKVRSALCAQWQSRCSTPEGSPMLRAGTDSPTFIFRPALSWTECHRGFLFPVLLHRCINPVHVRVSIQSLQKRGHFLVLLF